jgi:1-acyl-sn-glycerol-3-phosphate acyltransferase
VPSTPEARGFGPWAGRAFLRLMGWRLEGAPPAIDKYVVIAAPHTTNWDLPFMLAVGLCYGVRVSWLGKASLFRSPQGYFSRALGGIRVDRGKGNNQVEQAVALFTARDQLVLAIPPEGTRGRTRYWRTGFYFIAHGAGVPIVLGFLDYAKKVGGVGGVVMPTGSIESDMREITAFYSGVTGKYPTLQGEVEIAARQ